MRRIYIYTDIFFVYTRAWVHMHRYPYNLIRGSVLSNGIRPFHKSLKKRWSVHHTFMVIVSSRPPGGGRYCAKRFVSELKTQTRIKSFVKLGDKDKSRFERLTTPLPFQDVTHPKVVPHNGGHQGLDRLLSHRRPKSAQTKTRTVQMEAQCCGYLVIWTSPISTRIPPV
jgi:hypothetical protein